MKEILYNYKQAAEKELSEILRYWMNNTIDEDNGGFIGKIDHYNTRYPDAPKGAVLHARILWSFSAAYNLTKDERYSLMATRAYEYLQRVFVDQEFGGVYWTVTPDGQPLDTKKQLYALAFAVYGVSEYYLASGDEQAKLTAIGLYHIIVQRSYDAQYGGYFEAFTRDWKALQDIRLSEKDANARKTMNTHLHILEAFANLYRIWPDDGLKKRLVELVCVFGDQIISPETGHLILFFQNDWTPSSTMISYGHDIEAAWLVQEVAALTNDPGLLTVINNRSLLLANAATEGLDNDGGLWYEYDAAHEGLVKQKHSWPQAEAMVGFLNAWQIDRDEKWLQRSFNSWNFIRQYLKDPTYGEWYWGVLDDHSPMINEDKAGIWKCPYHNSRACMEIIKRSTAIKS